MAFLRIFFSENDKLYRFFPQNCDTAKHQCWKPPDCHPPQLYNKECLFLASMETNSKEQQMLSLLGTMGLIVVWLITWLMTFDGSKATDTTKALKSEMNDILKDL